MTRNRPTARRGEAPGRTKEAAMYMHELLIRARQAELLRAAAQHRLAADVRRARPSVAVRVAGRAGRRPSPPGAAWAGAQPAAPARAPAAPGRAATGASVPGLRRSAAEGRLSSSLGGVVVAAVPVIGVGVARVAGDAEPLTALRWAGLAVGLGGVALLMGPGASGAGAWPVLEVLGTAVCYAIGPVIADRKLADADSLAVTAACLGLAAVVYAPAAALTWPHQMPPAPVLSALAVLAVVCTPLAFILYFRLISEVAAVRAPVITYVSPAVAVALGAAVLGPPFTPVIAISFTLILAGSVLATRPAAHRGAGIPPPRNPGVARAGTQD